MKKVYFSALMAGALSLSGVANAGHNIWTLDKNGVANVSTGANRAELLHVEGKEFVIVVSFSDPCNPKEVGEKKNLLVQGKAVKMSAFCLGNVKYWGPETAKGGEYLLEMFSAAKENVSINGRVFPSNSFKLAKHQAVLLQGEGL